MDRLVNGEIVKVGDLPPKTPEKIEADYQATVPKVVSMRKAELYLIRNGLIDPVNALVAAQGAEAISEWARSHEVQRSHPLLNYVLDELGYSELGKDQVFFEADKII